MVHFLGITLTVSSSITLETVDRMVDQVALGDAFEDLAETPAEPVEPERAKVPEPPVETTPEPDRAESVASDVRVLAGQFAECMGQGAGIRRPARRQRPQRGL